MKTWVYTCRNCGAENKKSKEIGWFKCRKCKKKSDAINPRIEETDVEGNISLSSVEEETESHQSPSSVSSIGENIDFAVTGDDVPVDKIQLNVEQKPQQAQPIQRQSENYSKRPLSPDIPRKMFEQLDALMVKKSNKEIWDISKEEEKKLADAWTDALNDVIPEMTSTQAKFALALSLTALTYAPRVSALVDAHKRKKSATKGESVEEKKEEPEPVEVVTPIIKSMRPDGAPAPFNPHKQNSFD